MTSATCTYIYTCIHTPSSKLPGCAFRQQFCFAGSGRKAACPRTPSTQSLLSGQWKKLASSASFFPAAPPPVLHAVYPLSPPLQVEGLVQEERNTTWLNQGGSNIMVTSKLFHLCSTTICISSQPNYLNLLRSTAKRISLAPPHYARCVSWAYHKA